MLMLAPRALTNCASQAGCAGHAGAVISGGNDTADFKVEAKPDFKYTPVKGSFNKTKCYVCGEYVFERYVRTKDGQPVCIPCSGY